MHFSGLFVVNGNEILYSQETHITFWCPMRFNNFPLDKQVCKFKVKSHKHVQIYNFWHFVDIYKILNRLEVMPMMTQRWHSLHLCSPMMIPWETLYWITPLDCNRSNQKTHFLSGLPLIQIILWQDMRWFSIEIHWSIL